MSIVCKHGVVGLQLAAAGNQVQAVNLGKTELPCFYQLGDQSPIQHGTLKPGEASEGISVGHMPKPFVMKMWVGRSCLTVERDIDGSFSKLPTQSQKSPTAPTDRHGGPFCRITAKKGAN